MSVMETGDLSKTHNSFELNENTPCGQGNEILATFDRSNKSELRSDVIEKLSNRCHGNRDHRRETRDRKMEKQELLGRGQVKLRISVSGDKLVIFVQEAYGLKSQWKGRCSAYVQAEICENDATRPRPQTKVIPHSNCPVFSHSLVHVLRPEDEKKRLLISAWHQDDDKRCSEFLGCLSFGLRHLVAKCSRENSSVEGWYYLLSADVGHRKHLLASRKSDTGSAHSDQSEDKENQQQFRYLSYKLLHRDAGYGFTVRGPHPIRVGRIKVGGPAHEAGLEKNDVIMQINGQPIRTDNMQQVALTIRNSPVHVIIDVKRPINAEQKKCAHDKNCNSQSQLLPLKQIERDQFVVSESKKMKLDAEPVLAAKKLKEGDNFVSDTCSYSSTNSGCQCNNCHHSNKCDKNQNTYKEGMFCKPCGKQLLPGKSDVNLLDEVANQKLCNICDDDDEPIRRSTACEHVTCITNQLEESQCGSKSASVTKYTKWTPDISDVTRTSVHSLTSGALVESLSHFDEHLAGLSHLNAYKDLATLSREQLSYSSMNLAERSGYLQNTSCGSTASTTSCDYNESGCDVTNETTTTNSSPADESRLCDVTEFDAMSVSECSMDSETILRRDLCVRTILNCEESYVQQMQKGIQAYSRPLRVCITAQQKEVLFQNIEKLVALSRYNLTQLHPGATSLHEMTFNSTHAQTRFDGADIGKIYHSTMLMVCDAYTEYIKGLADACDLLQILQAQPGFLQLVQTQRESCDLDLIDFLQQPVVHFEFMRRGFQELLSHLDVESVEYGHVKDILLQFQSSCRILIQ